jgi:hypothetical protein
MMGIDVRKILMPIATLLAAIQLVGVVCAGRVLADDTVISYDGNARFVALGISKAIVIQLPTAVADVLVADPTIVTAIAKTDRQVYIIGLSVGQTNVYFFDGKGRQIDGLNIAVTTRNEQAELQNYHSPADTVLVYYGPAVSEVGSSQAQAPYGFFLTYSCTPFRCLSVSQPGADQPPGTQNINITGNGAGSVVVPGK